MVMRTRRPLVWRIAAATVALAAVSVTMGARPAAAHDPLPWHDVSAFGDAPDYGSTSQVNLAAPVVGMAHAPSSAGYLEAAADGGVFAFGDATFAGSMGGTPLNAPVVGIAPAPANHGYWLAAADGGVFAFGTAAFHGSMGGTPLNAPVVGIAATPGGGGYWLVASDGGVFAFGDAHFFGSMGGRALNAPVVGIAATPTADPCGAGYWLVGADGGVFAFGHACYLGSFGAGLPSGLPTHQRFVGMAASNDGEGYWLVSSGFCAPEGSTAPVSVPSSAPGAATFIAVSGFSSTCDDKIQFEFAPPAGAFGYDAHYVTTPVASPSGLPVSMAGNAFLEVTIHPVDDMGYTGPRDVVPANSSRVLEYRQTQDFEGYVTWVIGLDEIRPFWIGRPIGSSSLVVEIS